MLRCRLRLQPRSSRTGFGALYGDRLKLQVRSAPVEGKANAELTAFLAKQFGVPRDRIRLIAGATGRNKTIEIEQPTVIPDALRVQLDSTLRE